MLPRFLASAQALLATSTLALAGPALSAQVAGPTAPGAGNARALQIATSSPLVLSAYLYIDTQVARLSDANLRAQSYDAILNPNTCILHRANLKLVDRQAIVTQLLAAGLLNPADNATFPGGLITGVFPPVLDDNTACPHLPQPFISALGSSFGSHHSYPGGLPVHESNNETADINLASEYSNVYGQTGPKGLPFINAVKIASPSPQKTNAYAPYLDGDLILGAPLWHDWAKSIVFQWNADGTEFPELSIGGSGASLDDYGAAGDARTGGHHILSIAESMKRGFSPAFIITQAYNPANASVYNQKFRNVVLANYSAERLYTVYQAAGLDGVKVEIQKLRDNGSL